MSYFGGWIAVCVLLGLGQAWASFSTVQQTHRTGEGQRRGEVHMQTSSP